MSTRRYLANIIKLNKDLISKIIAEVFYFCTDKVEFPSESKHADIVPIHRKKDKSDKNNYIPVSIFYDYCKMYEKLIYIIKFICIFKIYRFQVNVDFEKKTIRNTVS